MTTEPASAWQSADVAAIWLQGAARRAQSLGPATEQMLDAASIGPGMRVLDIAAGTGDQSVPAARRVGASGSVLATDISSTMLEAAAKTAREAGLSNVQTQVADASRLDLPDETVDAAICRFGLMFVPDLHAALGHVRRVLKPGGKFAALVWSTEERNPYMGVQIGALRDMNRLPSLPVTLLRTVSLSAPGLLEEAFVAAGFTAVAVRPVDAPRAFASPDEALAAMNANSVSRADLLRLLTDAEREHLDAELRRRLGPYIQADGACVLPGEALLGVGTK